MKVSDAMTHQVEIANPDDPISDAARTMARIDAGALPVGENERLIGMITDRDIAIRGVAQGKSPDTPVREVMTADVRFCFEDDDLEQIADDMAELQVRRLPVVNRERRLVGIISLGDIARHHLPEATGEALQGVSRPGGQHDQVRS